MTRARRVDSNAAEIIATLRKCGADWYDCSAMPEREPGFPDGLVVIAGRMYLIEIKAPRGQFTRDQKRFKMYWRGPSIVTLRSALEAQHWAQRAREYWV